MMGMTTRNTRWRRFCLPAALLAALCLGAPGAGHALSFDLTADGDFGPKGTSQASLAATKDGVTLTLTSLSMTPEDEVALTNGIPSVLFVNAAGMGVRPEAGVGSKAISGGGAHADEVLIFSFSQPVTNVKLLLAARPGTAAPGLPNGSTSCSWAAGAASTPSPGS